MPEPVLSTLRGQLRACFLWMTSTSRRFVVVPYDHLGEQINISTSLIFAQNSSLRRSVSPSSISLNSDGKIEIDLSSSPMEFDGSDMPSSSLKFIEIYVGDANMDTQNQSFEPKSFLFSVKELETPIMDTSSNVYRINKLTVDLLSSIELPADSISKDAE